jgi:hypothetical protein
MSGVELQSRFVRALEARYAAHVTQLMAKDLDADSAHECALEQITDFGREALEELRRRGLFPWRSIDPVEDSPAGVEHPPSG